MKPSKIYQFAFAISTMVAAQALPLQASAQLMCQDVHMEASADVQNEFDQEAVSIEELMASQNGSDRARETYSMIQKLREKINTLRTKNGTWQTQANIDKMLAISSFETFVMLDEMSMIRTQFVSEMSDTEYAAWDYKMATASIEALKKLGNKATSAGDQAKIETMIEEQQRRQAQARTEFLASANDTMSIKLVLEKMKTQGQMIDASTLFGNSTALLDSNGNAVNMSHTEEVEETTPPPSAEEIMNRATKVDKMVGEFMGQESFRQMVASAQVLLGKDFKVKRLSFEELADLRKKLQPDWQSNEATIARLKKNYWEEKKLSIFLSVGGPQLIEFLQGVVGKMTGTPKLTVVVAPVAKLLGFEYERALRRKYLPRILEILRLRNPDEQLNALLSSEPTDLETRELIVSYIRVTMARDSWRSIMARLNSLANGQVTSSNSNIGTHFADVIINKNVTNLDPLKNLTNQNTTKDDTKDTTKTTADNTVKTATPAPTPAPPTYKGSYDAKLYQKLQKYEDEAITRGPFPIVGPPRSIFRTATQVTSLSAFLYLTPKLAQAGWTAAHTETAKILAASPHVAHMLQALGLY